MYFLLASPWIKSWQVGRSPWPVSEMFSVASEKSEESVDDWLICRNSW